MRPLPKWLRWHRGTGAPGHRGTGAPGLGDQSDAPAGPQLPGEFAQPRDMIDHKLAELAEQRHRIEVARTALKYGWQCPAGEPMKCSRFWSIIEGRLRGLSLEEGHERAH